MLCLNKWLYILLRGDVVAVDMQVTRHATLFVNYMYLFCILGDSLSSVHIIQMLNFKSVM